MPTIRGRKRGWRRGEDDQYLRKVLWSGHDIFGRFAEEELRAAWERLRDDILAEWIQKHPGTRPKFWWAFDAPERRRRVDGQPHPFDNPERIAHVCKCAKLPDAASDYEQRLHQLYYGVPRGMILRDDFEAVYETQIDYLGRLGLLEPGEAEAAERLGVEDIDDGDS